LLFSALGTRRSVALGAVSKVIWAKCHVVLSTKRVAIDSHERI
jgi:hypothetical protein